jgi:hypothetical protein
MLRRLAFYTPPLSLALLMIVAGCVSTRAPHPIAPALSPAASPVSSPGVPEKPAPALSSDYVGNRVCAGCHKSAVNKYDLSKHAHTLRAVTEQSDGPLFRSSQTVRDEEIGVTYHLEVQDGKCVQVAEGNGHSEVTTALYAFGGRRFGVSYLGRTGSGDWVELRMTYYTHLHRWYYTPFLQPDKEYTRYLNGLPQDAKQVALCFSCHVTTMKMGRDGPVTVSQLQVGCERCHGAGRPHVVGVPPASKSAADTHIADLSKAPQSTLSVLCGECHSSPADMPLAVMQSAAMARFPSNALEQSQCFRQSGTLTCVTCHDPHTLAPRSAAGYDEVCLSCHGGAKTHANKSVGTTPSGPEATPAVCKVNPRSGCIRCHMPVQTTKSFSLVGFHNHWIRIYR